MRRRPPRVHRTDTPLPCTTLFRSAATVTNRTSNDNQIAGAFDLDTSLTFDVEMAGKELELYLAVNNLLNKDPAVVAPGPAGSAYATPATNQSLYDLLGRTYRVGIRFKL